MDNTTTTSHERLRESVIAFFLCGLFWGCVAGTVPFVAMVLCIGSGIGCCVCWWRLQWLNDREGLPNHARHDRAGETKNRSYEYTDQLIKEIEVELKKDDSTPVDTVVIPLPEGFGAMTAEQAQAAAWKAIMRWCSENGLVEHSFSQQNKYRLMNGPETIAQWITDLKGQRCPQPGGEE